MIISTRRCRLGFLAFGLAFRSAVLVGQLGFCHTNRALSRVSKPWPPREALLMGRLDNFGVSITLLGRELESRGTP